MEVKLFELRDRSTFIPVLCVRLSSRNEAERYLLARSGYGRTSEEHQDYVLMTGVVGGSGEVKCSPFDWVGNRTRKVCHQHIIEHWDELESGQVVDYEFITGESAAPKRSEREDNA
jgi:hypothetical protein